jgi:hypothetical protein
MSTALLGGCVQVLAWVDHVGIRADGGGIGVVPTPGLGRDPMWAGLGAETMGGDGPQAVTGSDDNHA